MKKSLSIYCLVIFCLAQAVSAQRVGPGKPIVQSPYYDAILLYYALQGINAYPVPYTGPTIRSIQEPGPNGAPVTSGAPNAKITQASTSLKPTNNNATIQPNSNLTGQKNTFGIQKTATTPQDPSHKGAEAAGATPEASESLYTIIESSTGKILKDSISGDLTTVLKKDTFENPVDRKTFISAILARDAGITITSDSAITEIVSTNPYLAPLLDSIYPNVYRFSDSGQKISSLNIYQNNSPSFNLAGGSGSSVASMAINAYTDYVIDAVNAEIDDAFFIHLQKALGHFPELKILFPKVMKGIGKIEVTKYNQSINLLKSAYQEDIKNILGNIAELTTLNTYRDLINNGYPELTMIFMSCDLIDYIKKGNTAADILYQMHASSYIQNTHANDYSSALKLASLISYCLRNIKMGDQNTNEIGWVGQDQLKLLESNKDFFQLFTGLMAVNADSIHFKNGFDFRKALYDNKEAIMRTRYIVYNFIDAANNINSYIQQAAEALKSNSPTTVSSFVGYYINIALSVMGLADNCLAVLPGNKAAKAAAQLNYVRDTYIPFLDQANRVVTKIEAQDYNAAIYELDTLLQRLYVGSDSSTSDRTKNFNKFEDVYLKYGSFIATIAASKTEADMKTAIKAFALPTGSSRIKKEHYFSIGLNSFVGFYHSWNTQYPSTKLPAEENGLTVPLGLAVTWGWNKYGSLTLFGGVIDVGAIFSYKVSSDSAVQANIQLGQILSPSIGVVYGFPIIKKYNIPLSFGANFQWGPVLKKVTDAGNSLLPLMTRRFNLFLALDIPFINFHVSKEYNLK